MEFRSIRDPKGLGGNDSDIINEKLSVAKTILARPPNKGGAPFIYTFASAKEHLLEDIKIPIFVDNDGNEEYFHTAATDGKKYFWHPEMIKRLNPVELSIVLTHETYHIICQHTDPDRVFGKNKNVWGIAIDYVVNAMIEHDFRQSNRIKNIQYKYDSHPIWKNGLGKPMYFKEIIESIRKEKKDIQDGKFTKEQKQSTKKRKPDLQDLRIYADYTLYGKSAEEIYDKLMEELKDLSDQMVTTIIKELNNNQLDEHKENNTSRSKLLQEIIEAITAAKQLDQSGSIPSAVKDKLLQLEEPKLSWQDIVRISLQVKRQEKGQLNDWSRFRRRNISLGIYSPKKKDQYVKWLAMLDTSGSMSSEDMTYGVSQLKCLDGRSEGIVVSCDAETYWDKAVKISSMNDLPNINPVGRGGTVFSSFFNEYREQCGDDFDLIIIMTDGGVFDLQSLKKPHCDVVWVLTSKDEFNPPFGKVAPMRRF